MRSIVNLFIKVKKKLRPIKRIRRLSGALMETHRLNKFMESTRGKKRVFYLGRTENNNIGDNGQHYCIKAWIRKNYADHELYITPSCHITCRFRFWLNDFEKNFDYANDIIVFQSGYSTQDLGGDHPLMHELICEHLKEARILMMPQTIFFQHEENRVRTARNHDGAKNMLFLARDRVSYKMA